MYEHSLANVIEQKKKLFVKENEKKKKKKKMLTDFLSLQNKSDYGCLGRLSLLSFFFF